MHVPRGEELTPLLSDDAGAGDAGRRRPRPPGRAARRPRGAGGRLAAPEFAEHAFALPLLSDARVVAVATGAWSHRVGLESLQVARHLDAGRPAPGGTTAVQLDTALLFAAFRDTATASERRRLAREMHDGVAQDIASLGYLVDGLVARAATPEQAAQLRVLRERISTVVADVRQSVKSLRTEVGRSASLGAAIAGLARHLSDSSGIPIQVTVDERTARLRPEVEAELLRIAQEAMTNAVKHARASLIEVRCLVDAPAARIEVHDDGSRSARAPSRLPGPRGDARARPPRRRDARRGERLAARHPGRRRTSRPRAAPVREPGRGHRSCHRAHRHHHRHRTGQGDRMSDLAGAPHRSPSFSSTTTT